MDSVCIGECYSDPWNVCYRHECYVGAPRLGNAALGRRIWTSFSAAALKTTLEILEGADPAKYPRYLPLMASNPPYQEWIASANERDRAIGERQQAWNARRQEDAKGEA